MSQSDFLGSIPSVVYPYGWGLAVVEVKVGRLDTKFVCYRGVDNNISSYGTYGASWEEVYEKLSKTLRRHGHME